MDDIFSGLAPLLGPIVAALIAGAVAFLVLVLTKENKTSEFRQAWIDGLRDDIAKLSASMSTMASMLDLKSEFKEDLAAFRTDKHDSFVKMRVYIDRIRLRLNVDEHTEMLQVLSNFHDHRPKEGAEIQDLCEQLVTQGHIILKTEWERVKAGERAFVLAKNTSVVLAGMMLAFAIITLIGRIVLAYSSWHG